MEPNVVERMRSVLGISRVDQPGFSVALPWAHDSITEQSIISGIVSNYYFPLLSGRLVAEVGNRIVSKERFHEVATALMSAGGIPFSFVEAVSAQLGRPPDAVAAESIGADGLSKSALHPSDLEKVKELYRQGRLIHVTVPVRLKPKQGTETISTIDLFLSQLPEGAKPFALFVRGPITLIGERRYFGGMPAHAALVATEDTISAFLGDAENPAHTAWNSNAEKLTKNWRSPARTLKNVRYSLRQLYDLVAERIDRTDPDALIDYFSLADQPRASETPKRRNVVVPPPLPVRQKAVLIKPRQGGFAIAAGPGATGWTFPRTIRIRIAYDIVGGDPFKRHSRFDFDLSKGEMQMVREYATAEVTGSNIIMLKAESAEFKLELSGFDEKRDLVVSARVSP